MKQRVQAMQPNLPRVSRAGIPIRVIVLGGYLLGAAACGDDDEDTAKRVVAPTTLPGGNTPSAAGGPTGALNVYKKIEDLVSEEEAQMIRHQFQASDFQATDDIRDPFRSFVVDQIGAGSQAAHVEVDVKATEVCTERNMVAPNPRSKDPRARATVSLRELRLIGIVKRGGRSHAMFMDNTGYAHIVARGDCLAKEKARVEEIGAGFVRLEIVPDPVPNAPPRPPQPKVIQLHPDEFQVTDGVIPDEAIDDLGVSDVGIER